MKGFDIEKMFIASKKAIEKFVTEHSEETFFAFSIDANMLCLNSEEEFKKTLKYYQEKYPESYNDNEKIDELKYNTGDWGYQGFFDLEDGFDHELYSEHYHIPFDNKDLEDEELAKFFQNTPYHRAMSKLLEKLVENGVFDSLKKTTDFKVFLSEHNY
jgi:hypothetical protein